jgi:hypothetical protein
VVCLVKKFFACNPKYFFAKKDRGFIGPIGDDLPSLIPIMISLTMFFMIFSTTLLTFNNKNDLVDRQVEMTSIARELKGDSLLLSVSQFQKRCNVISLKKLPYNFIAAVYSSESDVFQSVNDFASLGSEPSLGSLVNTKIFFEKPEGSASPETEKDYYFCSYLRIGAKEFTGEQKSHLLRFYPVAIQTAISVPGASEQYVVVPGIMAMVIWE